MQLLIDIPDEMYDTINRGIYSSTYDGKIIRDIVLDGTPLPKGHGKLKDENEIKQMIEDAKVKNDSSKTFAENIIKFASTIIEANNESEVDE